MMPQMNSQTQDKEQLNITVKIADTEPIHFTVARKEEVIYRKAEYHVNQLWKKWAASGRHQSADVLARVALAFAELYYRKADALEKQAAMIDTLETELDAIIAEILPDN